MYLGYKEKYLTDPNRIDKVLAEQHGRDWEPDGNTANEEWADMWANYAASNIDLASEAGRLRADWITNILRTY